MADPITWRNVNAVNQSSNIAGVGAAGTNISQGIGTIADTLSNAGQKQIDDNTEGLVNQINSLQPDQLDQAITEGTFSATNLDPNQVNTSEVLTALNNRQGAFADAASNAIRDEGRTLDNALKKQNVADNVRQVAYDDQARAVALAKNERESMARKATNTAFGQALAIGDFSQGQQHIIESLQGQDPALLANTLANFQEVSNRPSLSNKQKETLTREIKNLEDTTQLQVALAQEDLNRTIAENPANAAQTPEEIQKGMNDLASQVHKDVGFEWFGLGDDADKVIRQLGNLQQLHGASPEQVRGAYIASLDDGDLNVGDLEVNLKKIMTTANELREVNKMNSQNTFDQLRVGALNYKQQETQRIIDRITQGGGAQ